MKGKIHEIKKIAISDHNSYQNRVIVERVLLDAPFGFHWHSYYEIEYVTGGSGEELINGELVSLFPGVMHVVSPADFHELLPTPSLSLIKICFDTADIDPSVLTALSVPTANRRFCFTGQKKELFDSLFFSIALQSEMLCGEADDPRMLRRQLETILLSAKKHDDRIERTPPSKKQSSINATLAYVQSNFTQPLSLVEVAAHLHFSPSYLSRSFHESLGISFSKYVRHLRMELAARLLLNTDSDVTDICYEVGLTSTASFSEEFKKHHGVPPGEYRRKRGCK